MEMTTGTRYLITKRIKLHTKPLRFANITLEGAFKYATDGWYCFNGFRVKKSVVIEIKEK